MKTADYLRRHQITITTGISDLYPIKMCTILFSYKSTPGYKLIVAANRDEFLHRSTAPLAYWSDCKDVLAGRDLQAGGTWLGLNRKGRIGGITNFREPQVILDDCPSRGELLSQYLVENTSGSDFLRNVKERASKFRGFNLLLGDGAGMYYYSNRAEEIIELNPGVYGLSNHLLDSDWPKIKRGKMLLNRVLSKTSFDAQDLFSILGDTHQPAKDQLPDTGVGEIWERLLSTIFISSGNYGTRSSAVIIIKENGYTEFRERSFIHGENGRKTEQEKCYTLNGS